jgi:hypothetical protein
VGECGLKYGGRVWIEIQWESVDGNTVGECGLKYSGMVWTEIQWESVD